MEVKLDAIERSVILELVSKLPGGESGSVVSSSLQAACEALCEANRYSWSSVDDEKGWLVAEQLKRHGDTTFCEWWVGEDRSIALQHFMSENSSVGPP